MIHGLRIKDGKATYVSRFVKTSRHKQEQYFGGAKFMKVCFELSFFLNVDWPIVLSTSKLLGFQHYEVS